MEKPNVDDIFDDFEYKVEDKKKKPLYEKEDESEEENMKRRFQKELDIQNKERKTQFKRRNKEIWKEKRPGSFGGLGNGAYLLIILVLVAYIGIDFGFYHGKDSVAKSQPITSNAVDNGEEKVQEKSGIVEEESAVDEETEEITAEEAAVGEETEEEEKKLSGKILMGIDKIYSEVVDADNDLGYITKIDFIIENGKDSDFTPLVHVFVYDSELHESWEIRSRGEYKGIIIKSGETKTASILISPKTFRNLNLEKNLGEIKMHINQKLFGIRGLAAKIISEISQQDINITEIITCLPDFLIYVKEKDLPRTHEILINLCS